MRNALAAIVMAAALIPDPLAGQGVEFTAASLKPSTGDNVVAGGPFLANGEVRLINFSMRTLVAFAFPLDAFTEIVNLPPWADSERYDLVGAGRPGASTEERQEMVRALLGKRARLVAHFEPRDQESYSLVLARDDGQLGPGLTPSTLDCSAPPSNTPTPRDPPAADLKTAVMNRCNVLFTDPSDETSYAGGVRLQLLVRAVSAVVGKPVIDHTGLTGYYALNVRFQRSPDRPASAASPDPAPLVFTALPEQLGLKLEPDHVEGRALVIDQLERPEGN